MHFRALVSSRQSRPRTHLDMNHRIHGKASRPPETAQKLSVGGVRGNGVNESFCSSNQWWVH